VFGLTYMGKKLLVFFFFGWTL